MRLTSKQIQHLIRYVENDWFSETERQVRRGLEREARSAASAGIDSFEDVLTATGLEVEDELLLRIYMGLLRSARVLQGRKIDDMEDADLMIQSAGTIIIDRDQNPLDPHILCLRAYNNWGFPKGKAEPGETKEQTATRETLEETGLESDLDWSFTGEQTPSVTYGSGKKKKTASYFMADRLSEKKPCLPVNPELGHPEHDEWKWVPASQLYDIMPKRLGPVIEYIQQSLGDET
jgi:bis(5'-nucleosidyl)-tetraphosphatase